MKQSALRSSLALLALTSAAGLLAPQGVAQAEPAQGQKKTITFADLAGRQVRYRVNSPRATWVGDTQVLEVRAADPKKQKLRTLHIDARTGDTVESPKTAAVETAGGRPGRPGGRDSGPGARVDRRSGQVVFVDAAGKSHTLTKGDGAKREVHVSPTGQHVSYVEDNNLVVTPIEGGDAWQVTQDGGPEMFHGVLDWVYQEEVYGRGDFQAHWWNEAGTHIAFISLDESPVKDFTVIDHAPARTIDAERAVIAEITRYPKAGDPNPIARFSVANVASQSVQAVDLSGFPDDALIVRVGWTPASDKVVFQVQNRIQTWLELCYADPSTGEVTRLIREESPTWVNVLGTPRWLDDGTFLWWSERTGYKHLYHYSADGAEIAQVTKGGFPVRRIQELDVEKGMLWFRASPKYPADEHLFRVKLDGTDQVQLTHGRGMHSVDLSADRSMFVDTVSSLDSPPEVRICDGDGKVLRTLESGAVESEFAFCPTEVHVVEARDGFPLDATVIKPLGFDANGGPYPVWIETYSGPEAPSVRNRWRVSPWTQFLAHQGIIVLQVNVRTASLAGHKVVGQCYQQFLVQELKDLEDTVKWLTAEPWADADRVGITGWSYGGSMTAYALTHSKLFRVGIAGAGVYDWQLYDTIYTERYMNTPQANPAGYAKSSVINGAKDLHGFLVLVHGTMDDNVHLQNTIRLAGELQRHGKDFEMMLYPKSRHGVRSPHLQQLRWKVIQRELLQ